jgi:hypothetical protein
MNLVQFLYQKLPSNCSFFLEKRTTKRIRRGLGSGRIRRGLEEDLEKDWGRIWKKDWGRIWKTLIDF